MSSRDESIRVSAWTRFAQFMLDQKLRMTNSEGERVYMHDMIEEFKTGEEKREHEQLSSM